jgi:uncharacterized HAD superfamily protein
MRKEKIGFDLDSVICDVDKTIVDYLITNFNLYLDRNRDFGCYEFDKNPNLNSYTAESLDNAVRNGDLFKEALPFKDVLEGFAIIKSFNFSISIITSRGSKSDKDNQNMVKKVTFDWLKSNNIEYDAIYFVRSREKKNFVKDLNIKAFVEDRFDIINMILEECGPLPYGLIVVDKPWNNKYHNKSVDRVKTFKEACELIAKYKTIKAGGK